MADLHWSISSLSLLLYVGSLTTCSLFTLSPLCVWSVHFLLALWGVAFPATPVSSSFILSFILKPKTCFPFLWLVHVTCASTDYRKNSCVKLTLRCRRTDVRGKHDRGDVNITMDLRTFYFFVSTQQTSAVDGRVEISFSSRFERPRLLMMSQNW